MSCTIQEEKQQGVALAPLLSNKGPLLIEMGLFLFLYLLEDLLLDVYPLASRRFIDQDVNE